MVNASQSKWSFENLERFIQNVLKTKTPILLTIRLTLDLNDSYVLITSPVLNVFQIHLDFFSQEWLATIVVKSNVCCLFPPMVVQLFLVDCLHSIPGSPFCSWSNSHLAENYDYAIQFLPRATTLGNKNWLHWLTWNAVQSYFHDKFVKLQLTNRHFSTPISQSLRHSTRYNNYRPDFLQEIHAPARAAKFSGF